MKSDNLQYNFEFSDKINFYVTVSSNRVLLPIVEEQTNNKIEEVQVCFASCDLLYF